MMTSSGGPDSNPFIPETTPYFKPGEFHDMDTLLPNQEKVLAPEGDSDDPEASFGVRALANVRISPQGTYLEHMGRKVGNVLEALRSDVKDSPNRTRTIGSFVAAAGVQTFDRLHLSLVVIPAAATEVLNDTHNAPLTGLAAAGAFMGLYLGVGSLTAEGMDQHPQAVEAAAENFPSVVELFDDALPGIDPPEKMKGIRDIPQRFMRRLKRGVVTAGAGTSAHVATAGAKGFSRGEMHKLNVNAALDGSVVIGAAVTGAAQAILWLGGDHPENAKFVQDQISSTRNWYLVALGAVGWQWYSTHRKKKRELREQQEQDTVLTSDTPEVE